MVELLVVLLVIAAAVWLLAQFAPLPGWMGKAALIAWVVIVTLMLAGVRFAPGGEA